MKHDPHPDNVPGDFYVENGCCTMCEVPFIEAPELFGTSQDSWHCCVKKQPSSRVELDRMLITVGLAELKCIRYRGSDRSVQIRLVSAGDGDVCDVLPPDLQQLSDQIREERRLP